MAALVVAFKDKTNPDTLSWNDFECICTVYAFDIFILNVIYSIFDGDVQEVMVCAMNNFGFLRFPRWMQYIDVVIFIYYRAYVIKRL